MALEEEGRRLSDGGRAETQSKKKLAPKQAKAAQSAARAAAASRHGRRSNDSASGAEGEDAPAAAAAAAAAPKGRGPRGAKGKTPKMQKAKGTTAKCQHGRRKAVCKDCGGSSRSGLRDAWRGGGRRAPELLTEGDANGMHGAECFVPDPSLTPVPR